ncbi:MAG: tripartite tricarboxylate transporter substrate binding protein [Variovorax sp.]
MSTMHRRDFARRALATAALPLLPAAARAQADWPSKPLRIVVPSAAGTAPDNLARIYSEHLKTALNQTVIIENRPGANQTIGISAVTSSPADGYTLLQASTELVRVPLLYPSMRYDPFELFAPVAQMASTSSLLCVHNSTGATTMQEFIEFARKSPVPISYGTPGNGSATHVYMELMAQHAGIKVSHIAYRGETALAPDLATGRLTAGWLTGGAVRQFQKDIRPLMSVSVRKRLTNYPDVPTGYELKIPGMDIEGFVGFFLLKGTPSPIVERLATEIDRITARPEVRAQILSYALEVPPPQTRAQFAAMMKTSADEWAKVIRQSGVKVE